MFVFLLPVHGLNKVNVFDLIRFINYSVPRYRAVVCAYIHYCLSTAWLVKVKRREYGASGGQRQASDYLRSPSFRCWSQTHTHHHILFLSVRLAMCLCVSHNKAKTIGKRLWCAVVSCLRVQTVCRWLTATRNSTNTVTAWANK